MTSHRVDVVVFTLALTVFGLVALALVWSGGWAYEVLARATGHTQTTFLDIGGLGSIGGGAFGVDLHNLLSWHGAWASYVVGLSPLPSGASTYFSADEVAHMADVRAVFRGAELAAVLALFVGVPMGVYTGLHRDTWLSRAVMAISLIGVSLPTFLTGILLIWIFAVVLGWLPSFGRGDVVHLGWWSTGLLTISGIKALILPAPPAGCSDREPAWSPTGPTSCAC